jgi:hypothetical protein
MKFRNFLSILEKTLSQRETETNKTGEQNMLSHAIKKP